MNNLFPSAKQLSFKEYYDMLNTYDLAFKGQTPIDSNKQYITYWQKKESEDKDIYFTVNTI